MISQQKLVEGLAAALDIDEATVAWIARKLEDADLMPPADTDATIAPLHAARLLVAIMGAARPLDAVDIVEAFETTPADRVFLQDPELGQHRTLPIEDAGIPTGAGAHFVEIARDFVSAVAHLIHLQATIPDRAPIPRFISLRRDAGAPLAELAEITQAMTDGRPGLFTLVFARRDARGHAVDLHMRPGLEIHATVPGDALRKLGDLFAAPAAGSYLKAVSKAAQPAAGG